MEAHRQDEVFQAAVGVRVVPLLPPDIDVSPGVHQGRRIGTVIQNLIHCAARMVRHGRQPWLRYGAGNRWGPSLRCAYAAFA
jgi:hypothetical protein